MRSLVLFCLIGVQVGLGYIPGDDDEGGFELASAADWQQAADAPQLDRGLSYIVRSGRGSKLSGLATRANSMGSIHAHFGSAAWEQKFGPHPKEGMMVFQQHQLRERGAGRLRSEAEGLRKKHGAEGSWASGAGLHANSLWGIPMATEQASEKAAEDWIQHLPMGSKLAAVAKGVERGVKELQTATPMAKTPTAKQQVTEAKAKSNKLSRAHSEGGEANNAWIVAALTREMEDDGVTPKGSSSSPSGATPWDGSSRAGSQQKTGKVRKTPKVVSPLKIVKDVISPKKPDSKLEDEPDPAPPVEDEVEQQPEPESKDDVEEEWEEVEEDAGKVFDLDQFTWAEIPLHMWAWWIALVAVIVTVIISIGLIMSHLETYERPEVQKYVIRILFMTPLYAVIAFLSLTFTNAALFLNVVRDCYEAFVLYNFLKMLYVWLGGERAVITAMAKKKQIQLPFPLHTIEPWEMGDEMFYNCKFGVLQYVVVIPVCAVVTFITAAFGAYEGEHWYSMDFWIEVLICASATWAIYCLITFYLSMQEELEASVTNALGKFLCVKAVVFFCFWQGIVLHLVLAIGYMPETQQYSAKNFVIAIEQWLICLEMLVIAICFNLAYPVKEITEMRELNLSESSPYGSTDQKKPSP